MCDFPARQLVQYAYKITNPKALDYGAKLVYGGEFIELIGRLSRCHEDHTGCGCAREAFADFGLGNEKPDNIAAIPTVYAGVTFRSRLEARYAAFFDLVKWKWEYEPFDLNGWTPDFRLVIPCDHSECAGSHTLLVEVKPYISIDQFKGPPEYELAMRGYGEGLSGYGCDAVALFGHRPNISYWEIRHGANGGIEDIPTWRGDWGVAWRDAGNLVQYRKPEQPTAGQKRAPATAHICAVCFRSIPEASGRFCDLCRKKLHQG